MLPVNTDSIMGLILAGVFGIVFGLLLHRGGVANYNVIVNQFRFKDFTVLKIMLTAIVVGGIGVLLFNYGELARWHIKSADMLAVTIGAALFGIGMAIYGYCPGTGVAAIGTGSVHALVGFVGMLAGGVAYAYSYPWMKAHVLSTWSQGKIRLPEITGTPDWWWYAGLAVVAVVVFLLIEFFGPKNREA